MHELKNIVGWIFLATATLIGVTNFFLVFIRPTYYRLRKEKYNFISVVPLIGNICLVFASLFLAPKPFFKTIAIALFCLDTGGLPWILIMFAWNLLFVWRKQKNDSQQSKQV